MIRTKYTDRYNFEFYFQKIIDEESYLKKTFWVGNDFAYLYQKIGFIENFNVEFNLLDYVTVK